MAKPNRAVITTDTLEESERRVLEDAKALGRADKLKPEIRITFEDPADLVRALTSQRVRILQCVRVGAAKSRKYSLSSLASKLKRHRASVNRDVAVLEGPGLLRTRTEANPGHGRVKVVEPLAKNYHLAATL